MKSLSFWKIKIGILGGGQLARMLVLKGTSMGFLMYVLSEKKTDPAAEVTQNWIQGNPLKTSDLKKFLPKVDLLTFENEFLDLNTLSVLGQKFKIPIFPKSHIMSQLQDRWEQKNLFLQSKLPTLPVTLLKNKKEAKTFFQNLKFSKDIVLKKRRAGYDGYGTFMFSKVAQKESNFFKNLDFIFEKTKEGFIAEEKISFQRELAFSVARNQSGEMAFLPLVETYQENACCIWVKGPVTQKQKFLNLKRKIKLFLNQIHYEGIIAFELFEKNSNLLINEVAPRVHNSAHYSQSALLEDQFSLHLKAILNQPLKNPKLLTKGFAMLNLLGTKEKTPMNWSFPPHVHFHWYGKKENRKGRKMGHINALDQTPNQALNHLLNLKKQFKL